MEPEKPEESKDQKESKNNKNIFCLTTRKKMKNYTGGKYRIAAIGGYSNWCSQSMETGSDINRLAELVKNSVVHITAILQGQGRTLGSGFIISIDGFVKSQFPSVLSFRA